MLKVPSITLPELVLAPVEQTTITLGGVNSISVGACIASMASISLIVTSNLTGKGGVYIDQNTITIDMINKAPLVIKTEDFELNSDPFIFKLKSYVAESYCLKSWTLDYSYASLFSGPTISYNVKLGSITFSGLADDAQALGDAKADETENV